MTKLISFLFFVGITTYGSAQNQFLSLEGEWRAEFNSSDIGLAQTVLTFETDNNTFTAHTRRGATQDILGFWKSSLAKIFTDDFKKGALIHITDGVMEEKNDTLFLRGIFRSAIGNYYFNGELVNDSLTARLTNRKKDHRGSISATKAKVTFPLADYPQIVNQAIRKTEDKIFNPQILESKEWKSFEKKLSKTAAKIKDDIEMVFTFYYLAGDLPMSHYSLVKVQSSDEKEETASDSLLTLVEKSKNTAYLKIQSFGGTAKEMDRIFSIIKGKNYPNLIVDLRNNSGGTVEAGMAFAKNVVDTTLLAGVFLTQKWFAEHHNIPKLDEYEEFPHFSASNYDLIIRGIHREKGLVLKVIPNEETFQGGLFILTNKNTASTCEPIVYSLKKQKRATIVGETTAGAMLNGEFFDLSDGFSLVVPTADYYTSDGYKIDQKGVTPNIEVESANALDYVIEHLIEY